MRRLLCAFVCVVSLGTTGKAQRAPIEFNWWDANDLLRQLLVAIDPARPENIYMPQLLREKIAWVFSENKAGRLILNFSPSPQRDRNGKENRGALMDATKNQSGALVNIYAGTLMYFVRYKRGVRQGFDEVSKDGFALSLAHEAIHLEQPLSFFLDRNFHPEEEDRAWRTCIIQIIRPMRASGRKMELDRHKEADDILRRCHDRPSCPDFVAFITRS